MMIVGVVLYLGGLVSLVLGVNYILSMLMSLEFMMMSIFILLLMVMLENSYELILIYMVFSVCEASLGLGLLVMGVMGGGNIYYSSFDMLKW